MGQPGVSIDKVLAAIALLGVLLALAMLGFLSLFGLWKC